MGKLKMVSIVFVVLFCLTAVEGQIPFLGGSQQAGNTNNNNNNNNQGNNWLQSIISSAMNLGTGQTGLGGSGNNVIGSIVSIENIIHQVNASTS